MPMDNSERQTEDCYYFIQSACKKDKDCTYRHNYDAKQSIQVCPEWERTKKCRQDCPLRHNTFSMQKKKSDEYCYFEDKGAGCTKHNCEFKHRNPLKDQWKQHRPANDKFGILPSPTQEDSFVRPLSNTEKSRYSHTNSMNANSEHSLYAGRNEHSHSNNHNIDGELSQNKYREYDSSEYIRSYDQNREYHNEPQPVQEYDLIEYSSNVPSPSIGDKPWLNENVGLSDSEMKYTIGRTKKELDSAKNKNNRSTESLNDGCKDYGLNADEKYFKTIIIQNQSIMDKIRKVESEILEVDSFMHSMRK